MAPADIEALATVSLVAATLLGVVGACLALLVDGHRPPMIAATLASVACAIAGIGVVAGPAVEFRLTTCSATVWSTSGSMHCPASSSSPSASSAPPPPCIRSAITTPAGPASIRSPTLSFLLVLVGFGTKAGMMPLHVWLPRAHPAAPSHVSALMSGVMIKAGIYGFVRFGIEFLAAGPAWWGVVVLAIGAASAILGVLYALAEHDLKRLLAFHSVENIGIILLGLGVALIGMTEGVAPLAVVGLGPPRSAGSRRSTALPASG